MKKNIKRLITVLAVCAVSAFAVVASGCSVTDKIKEKIEQARCEHEWNDGEVIKEATCMEKGELTKTCTLCDKVETEEIELAEHIAVYVQAVTPTCSEKGVTDGTVCSVCETKISGFQELPALGHIVVKDSAVAPACLEDGLTEGEHCSRCNEVLKAQEKVPATGHNLVILEGVEPTCTTEGKTQGVWCDKCKDVFTAQEIAPVLNHYYVDGACEYCNKIDYSVLNTEVDIVAGETVAGHWYRIYRPESENVQLRLDNYVFESRDSSVKDFYFMIFPQDHAMSGVIIYCVTPSSSVNGLEVVKTDDYIDIYLAEGTYTVNNCSITITKDTIIGSWSDGAIVKRLEMNPVEQ